MAGFAGISAVALLVVTVPHVFGGRAAAQHQTRLAFRAGASEQPLTGLRPKPPTHLVSSHASRPVSHAHRSAPSAPVLVASTTTTTSAPITTHTAAATPTVAKHPTVRHHSVKPAAAVAVSHHPTTSTHAAPRAPVPSHPDAAAPVSPGYVNPLAHASVTAQRIDQGVDYGGSGTLGAIGAGTITYVGTSNTGWPGAFIEFHLLGGPDAGRYVYYAEHVEPANGLHVGQRVSAGQAIATISGEIEIGWGAGVGTETYAAAHGQWANGDDSGNHASAAGKSFSALIASLGGPAGLVEG